MFAKFRARRQTTTASNGTDGRGKDRPKSRPATSNASAPVVPNPPSVPAPPAPPAPLVSPLQMTFDFELSPGFRPSSDSARPNTSDGLGIPKTSVSRLPPVLPPIRPLASKHEKTPSSLSDEIMEHLAVKGNTKSKAKEESDSFSFFSRKSKQKPRDDSDNTSTISRKSKPKPRDDSDNISTVSRKSKLKPTRDDGDDISMNSRGSKLKQRLSFDRTPDTLSVSRPTTSDGPATRSGLFPTPQTNGRRPSSPNLAALQATSWISSPTFAPDSRPSTAGGQEKPIMDSGFLAKGAGQMSATMLPPPRSSSPILPELDTEAASNRAFIDSRDKPYAHTASKAAPTQSPLSNATPNQVHAPYQWPPPNRAPPNEPTTGQPLPKQAPFRPSPINTAHDMPPRRFDTLQTGLYSPNMLSVPSPASMNFSNTKRNSAVSAMSTVSGTSLRAPKISGSRLSPQSSFNSDSPSSNHKPSLAGSHLSPSRASFASHEVSQLSKEPSPERMEITPHPSVFRGPASPSFAPKPTAIGTSQRGRQPSATGADHPLGQMTASDSWMGSPWSASPTVAGIPVPATAPWLDSETLSVSSPVSPSKPPWQRNSSPSPSMTEVAVHPSVAKSKGQRKPSSSADPGPTLPGQPPATSSKGLRNAPSMISTNLSGSTVGPSETSSKTEMQSPAPSTPLSTIGTPYGETSAAFPLPHRVATRPKTGGTTATVAGVSVPTHHTSAAKIDSAKSERRKTRLLNPIALLSRRNTGQEVDVAIKPSDEEKSAQAQAFARQKSVAAAGVKKVPEDFDPRIKGKVVHDFSAPKRATRSFSHSDMAGQEWQLDAADSVPSMPAISADRPSSQQATHVKTTSDTSSRGRRGTYSPIFREHLNEDPDTAYRVSSLNAEKLENRDFLQRASQRSTTTSFSQESAVLPPFARRSQQLDPMQASLFNDEDSKRSSDPMSARGHKHHSNQSSASAMSPIAARNGATSVAGHPDNFSPVSPSSMEVALVNFPTPSEFRAPRTGITATSQGSTSPWGRLAVKDGIEDADPAAKQESREEGEDPDESSERVLYPHRDSADAPEVVRMSSPTSFAPEHQTMGGTEAAGSEAGSEAVTLEPPLHAGESTFPDRKSSLGMYDPFSEATTVEQAVSVTASRSPPRLVEKRASAAGHSKSRASLLPKHHLSNASRFSFQFGGSAAEEEALEEKHRQIAASPEPPLPKRSMSPDEDEDDYFDEDAMDDMDEMEVQEQQSQQEVGVSPSPGLLHLQHAREQLQVHSSSEGSLNGDDDTANVTNDREVTYADHPAFRSHSALASTASHSRNPSVPHGGWRDNEVERYIDSYGSHHLRMTSDASVSTVNTNVMRTPMPEIPATRGALDERTPTKLRSETATSPEKDAHPSMQSPGAGSPPPNSKPQRPELPHRESGNSERNRVASGLSFASSDITAKHGSGMSASTVTTGTRITSASTAGHSESDASPTGLGLRGFDELNFGDGPDLTIDGTLQTSAEEGQRIKRGTKDSAVMPTNTDWDELRNPALISTTAAVSSPGDKSGQSAAYHGIVGKNIRARNAAINQNAQYAQSEDDSGDDDMYFDDGGFEQDITKPPSSTARLDENQFDNPAFLNMFNIDGEKLGHQRDISAATFSSVGSDGPYPLFAMGANPTKALQQQSQLLLDDLPLQIPTEPKLIPQRNPSEDAKRLGRSSKAPPLPPPSTSKEAMAQMQQNLHAYHAALADAATRAAADGKFLRMPSGSTMRTLSTNSKVVDDDKSPASRDDRSQYSRDENGERDESAPNDRDFLSASPSLGPGNLNRSISQETSGSRVGQDNHYSPPKGHFDFGFGFGGDAPTDDSSFGDFGSDDDIIAAANAEALATDDEGIYGQEFGFYANARPNSGILDAVNGGFFGPDGDDGLARNKSLKEPNLTPITERSEFSTRNSFINLGHAGFSSPPPSAGTHGLGSPALARMPMSSPLIGNEITSFDQLRKMRANAFGSSTGSLQSEGKGTSGTRQAPVQSPGFSARSSSAGQGYFGPVGGAPMLFGYSTESSGSSGPASAHAAPPPSHLETSSRPPFPDSPQSGGPAPASSHAAAPDPAATPRKPVPVPAEAVTVRKASAPAFMGAGPTHSRKGSDSVTYVREPNPAGDGPPRWVLERRRTSEQGQLELVGREVVQGGWI